MNVLIVLVFISIVLVAGGLLLLVFALNQRDFEHSDRLSLLPLSEPSTSSLSGARRSGDAQDGRTTDSVPSKP